MQTPAVGDSVPGMRYSKQINQFVTDQLVGPHEEMLSDVHKSMISSNEFRVVGRVLKYDKRVSVANKRENLENVGNKH